jgi:alginate O-acetyltransferase complex protein AlgI
MTILQIAILALMATVIGQLPKGRQPAMLAISALAIFWLQPPEPFVSLQFWLPFATITAVVLSWALTSTREERGLRQNWPAIAILGSVTLLAELNRYLKLQSVYVTNTPALPLVLAAAVAVAVVGTVLLCWRSRDRLWLAMALIGIILVFTILKSPLLMHRVMAQITAIRGGPGSSTIAADITWLGYSYLAFRVMHTIRDRQSGRLPSVTLGEYANYVIFFPSFTAGPIDRLERFIKELRTPLPLANEDWIDAGSRLFVGLFKKFVIADLLAVISLNDVLVSQVRSSAWMWVFLYAYAFRIYFDFSGYTDIAIGMGRLMGIRLPENFARPYLMPNIAQFWNSWHMTLTQWFRTYFFNPLTRALRSSERALPVWLMILIVQLSTMILIGLWHGITVNFALWGAWHGIGLFIHNRWTEFMRPRTPAWMQSPRGTLAANALGVFLTFNFVAVGWLFFVLSTPAIAWQAILKLVG